MSVRRAQREVLSDEFSEWMAYYTLEPFGEERADLRAGIVSAVVANAHRGRGRAFAPSDFMPEFGPRRKQSAGDLFESFRSFARRHNASVRE